MRNAVFTEALCAHCGTQFNARAGEVYCCTGCATVFNLIQGQGLGRFYDIRNQNPPVCSLPVRRTVSTYDFCDDPEFLKDAGHNGLKLKFYLEGINCTACLWLLEKLPSFCPDAASASVNMAASTIEVTRKASGSFAAIAETLDRFGYHPHPLRESDSSDDLKAREYRQDLIRIGIAGAFTGNIMIMAVSLYAGATGELGQQFRLLSGLLALPVLTYCAWPFYKSAFAALRTRHLNLDLPIVLAIACGLITSLWGIFGTSQIVYFDSLSMLIFLMLASRFFLKTVQNQHFIATHLEDQFLLNTVLKVDADGCRQRVSSRSLRCEDLIFVEGDILLPVDGIVEAGCGAISTAVLSGESAPVRVSLGLKVEAGSRNLSGQWLLRVKKKASETRLANILRETEYAARSKSKIMAFADRAASWFVTLVFAAAVGLVAWFFQSDPCEGISRALTLVIVTCPCVFGIAIPLSMSLAIRAAANRGILIKDATSFEHLWGSQILFFDKTGTLTTGDMEVLKVTTKDESLLAIAYGLELDQPHPVARAIRNHARQQGYENKRIENVTILTEGGVTGEYQGVRYALRPLITNSSENESRHDFDRGLITSSFGLFQTVDQNKNGELVARFELGDHPRAEAIGLLAWLRARGLEIRFISGDQKNVVGHFARYFGFKLREVLSGQSPEEKMNTIRLSRLAKKKTVMIGDGANDAGAIATADVGIAVCGSLDLSMRAADVYLTKPDLLSLIDLFNIAFLTKAAIRRNLFLSVSFNIFSGSLAILGIMTPLWAAVLMPLSSLTVVLSSVWTGKKLESFHLRTNPIPEQRTSVSK